MTVRRLKRSRWAFVSFAVLAMAAGAATSEQPEALEFENRLFPAEVWNREPIVIRTAVETRQAPRDEIAEGPASRDERAKAVEALGENPLATVFSAIGPDARLYAQHNITLSNPFMEGRIPGSKGNQVAADYIEFWFKKHGLGPAFPTSTKAADGADVVTQNASFRQPFQHGSTFAVGMQAVTLHPSGLEDMKLVPGKDFTILNMSGSGKVKGQVVFCGYGIEGPDGYRTFNDDADLTGMIALVMRFEPMDENGKSRWAERGWSPAAGLDSKIEQVARRKPAAIIVVNPPGAADPRSKQLITLDATTGDSESVSMPVIMITTEAANRLVSINGPLENFRARADEAGLVLKITDTRASIDVGIGREPVITDNVGAVLPGRGALASEYIVVGAHYDHVGYGTVGADASNLGKLHPGADDNASGTAGVLLMAGKLAESYAKLPADAAARSVLFLAFSAEESGLNGSIYYVNHPSVNLAKIQFMLNMDMIGRLRSKAISPKPREHSLEVEGTESAEGFFDLVKPHFDASGIEIRHGSSIASNSDHFSFYAKQIPILNFFTGYHADYHKPQDTFDHINSVGAARIVSMAHDITLALAQTPEKLKFTSRKRENKPAAAEAPAPRVAGGRVRFGVRPGSYDEAIGGIEVEEVFEGTSAADAGIVAGDRMTKWNGKSITDVETWMPLLRAAKVGDEVEVTVIRDGKEITVKVKLKGSEEGGR